MIVYYVDMILTSHGIIIMYDIIIPVIDNIRLLSYYIVLLWYQEILILYNYDII